MPLALTTIPQTPLVTHFPPNTASLRFFSRSLHHKDEETGTPTASSNDIHNTNRSR
jgi:hypothetical protein